MQHFIITLSKIMKYWIEGSLIEIKPKFHPPFSMHRMIQHRTMQQFPELKITMEKERFFNKM